MQIQWSEHKQYVVPVITIILGVAGWFWLQEPTEIPISDVSISPAIESPSDAVVTVYITGKVVHPGVIELPVGSRVIDAISAAGGLTIKLPDLNLARTLVDGEQIVVSKSSKKSQTTTSGKINLNDADQATLETVPGIGPVMAQRIIDFRQSHGRFQSLSDLDAISGIGPSLMGEFQKTCVVE